MKHSFFLFLFLCCLAGPLSAQILNDSTRNVYNPQTTRVFKEGDFLRGNFTTRPVDTSLTNMQRARFWYRDSTFYQELGNIGMAAKPLMFRFPEKIGARLGKNVFDRYMYDPYDADYFDTKSPYTHLFYVQGQQGEQIFEAKHVRSFRDLASFGLAFQRIAGNRQIGSQGRREEGQVDNLGFMFFTHLRNKSGRYHLFANFTIGKHEVVESGGINYPAGISLDSLDSYEPQNVYYADTPIWLESAANKERRNMGHLTHFVQLAKEYIKVYHTFDYRFQKNIYFDRTLPGGGNEVDTDGLRAPFYKGLFLVDSTNTSDSTRYREIENTVGLTGNHPLFYYNLYAKRRDAAFSSASLSTEVDTLMVSNSRYLNRSFGQNFIGGETQFKLRDIFNITVKGEYQLFQDYHATASARVKFLTFSQTRLSYSPALVEQNYLSNHFAWNNSFENIVADKTAAGLQGKLLGNTLRAEVARVNLQNYVYYNEDSKPVQLGEQLSFYTAYLHHHLKLRGLHLDHEVSYNKLGNATQIRLPEWMVNSTVYYEGFLFKKALFGQIGFEAFMMDDFQADAYNPVLQQFYQQNKFTVSSYPVVDFFITTDIKNFNLFLKMAHLNRGVPHNGYFTTPYYTGMDRSFIFGLKWMFFD
ncbi:MAG: putative porin [Adhaeribacter sp.]